MGSSSGKRVLDVFRVYQDFDRIYFDPFFPVGIAFIFSNVYRYASPPIKPTVEGLANDID